MRAAEDSHPSMRTAKVQRGEAQLRKKFFATLSFKKACKKAGKKAQLSYLAGSCTKSYIFIQILEILPHHAQMGLKKQGPPPNGGGPCGIFFNDKWFSP